MVGGRGVLGLAVLALLLILRDGDIKTNPQPFNELSLCHILNVRSLCLSHRIKEIHDIHSLLCLKGWYDLLCVINHVVELRHFWWYNRDTHPNVTYSSMMRPLDPDRFSYANFELLLSWPISIETFVIMSIFWWVGSKFTWDHHLRLIYISLSLLDSDRHI